MVEEMFAKLFTYMDCVLTYDDNHWGELVAIIDKALIRWCGGWYTINFRPGKLTLMS